MRKITKKDADSMGLLPMSSAKMLERELGNCSIGEGIEVQKSKWFMKSHPMNVARHRALYLGNSPIFKFKFKGKTTNGTSKDWKSYAILRVA